VLNSPSDRPSAFDFGGIFLATAAIIDLEICFLRLFSVTIWHHFAFLAISLAMFGLACSGLYVYLFPRRFTDDRTRAQLPRFGLSFAASVVASLALYLKLYPHYHFSAQGGDLLVLAAIVIVLIAPFFCGGLVLAAMFRRWPAQIGRLYGFDLVGSAFGCLAAFASLSLLSGLDAILLAALFAAASSFAFGLATGAARPRWLAGAAALGVALLLAANARFGFLAVTFTKGQKEPPKLLERWNSFSRVAVFDYNQPEPWMYANLSRVHHPNPGQKVVQIDASASSVITHFDGDLTKVDFLKSDITTLQYFLRPTGRMCTIGLGGGKDVLTALQFDYDEIVGVEYNPIMIELVTKNFRDFAGDLYRRPRVKIVQAEGRSFLRATPLRFDALQLALTDTFAATAAGAFALSENNLYTVEAFTDFLRTLKPDGLLSCSRYHLRQPVQSLRLLVIAREALLALGATDPLAHIVAITTSDKDAAVVNFLIKREPFTNVELDAIDAAASQLQVVILASPRRAAPIFAGYWQAADKGAFVRDYPYDISASRDDRPFYFYITKTRDLLRAARTAGNPAATILVSLTLVIFALTLAFLFGPLAWRARYPRGSLLSLLYFAVIGLGFMFVEMPLLQKYVLFLGHPMYALPVVLLSLLLFAGVGGALSEKLFARYARNGLTAAFVGVALLVGALINVLPSLFHHLLQWDISLKIAVTVATIAPLGLAMGAPFPGGIRFLHERKGELIPWAWGVNGAASVLAAVTAVAASLAGGFTLVLSVGGLLYLLGAALSRVVGER
jgi:spermidine synthase